MIFDIDHIGLSSQNIDQDEELLRHWGYEVSFREKALTNLLIKKTFLECFPSHHGLSLLVHPTGLNIELLDHQNTTAHKSEVSAICSSPPKNAVFETIKGSPDQLKYYPGLRSNVKIIRETTLNPSPAFWGIRIPCRGLGQAVDFWNILGFKATKEDSPDKLTFTSPLSGKTMILELSLQKNSNLSFLDDQGFTSLALVSNRISKEKNKLESAGHDCTEISTLKVNDKLLEIFFTRDPGGFIIEVISPKL